MTAVTFPLALGGDGSIVTDDSSPITGLANGGHRTRFVPALAQVVAVANGAVSQSAASVAAAGAQANAAAASAATATSAAGTNATSTTSLTIATGAQTLTVQTGKAIVPGMQVVIANTAAPAAQLMRGTVTAYNSGTGALSVTVDFVLGSGTVATWTVSLTGAFDTTRAAALPIVPISVNTTALPFKTYLIAASCTLNLPAIAGDGKQIGVIVLNGVTAAIIAPSGADKVRNVAGNVSIDNAPFSAILTDSGATYGWV